MKSKCLNREEFVVVGWTDPEGSRSHIGALLLGYYTEDGQLRYAGRAGTGISARELKRLADVLRPLQAPEMPLAEPPPRDSRFGSPLKLSRVHWVRPEVVVEVTYLTWTEDNLLRQVSYQGQREDKPARQVVRGEFHALAEKAPAACKQRTAGPRAKGFLDGSLRSQTGCCTSTARTSAQSRATASAEAAGTS